MKSHKPLSRTFYFRSIFTSQEPFCFKYTNCNTEHSGQSDIQTEGEVDVLLLSRHQVVDGLAFLQLLLHLHQQLDSIHHHLHQLHLREAQSVCVGNVKHSSDCSRVHAA